MKRLFFTLLAILAMLMVPMVASADYTLSNSGLGYAGWQAPKTGDPSLTPYTGGVPADFAFNSFTTYFTDGTTFAGAGTISMSVGGWTAVSAGDVSTASGPLASTMTWDYQFAGPLETPLVFDINYFNGGEFRGHEHYTLNAGSQYFGGFDMTAYPGESQVPLPPTVMLLGSGLLGMIGLRRKCKAKV